MSHLRLPTVLAPGMRGHAPRTSWRRPHLKSPLSPAPTSQPWLGALVILTSHLSPLRSAAPTCSLDAALPWSQKTAGCAVDSGGVGRCPSFGLEAPVLCWVIGNVAEGAGGRRGQNRHVGRTGGPAVSPGRQRAARPASPRGLPRGAGGRRWRRPSLPVASRCLSFFPLQETRPSAEVAGTRRRRGGGPAGALRGDRWHRAAPVASVAAAVEGEAEFSF